MTARVAVFAGVGAAGFCVQMLVLALLIARRWPPAAATAAAVEAAVLTNFCLHECWTWRDRTARRDGMATRLWRFHAANGFVSVAGNVAVTLGAMRLLNLPPAAANIVAIAATATVNYRLADRWVFRAS